MATNAAIYLRISLDQTGEGLAVDRQREDCIKLAADRGWTVTETYIDNSISASSRKVRRPAYDRMVADHKAGKFTALVCWDLDRLTRQPRQLEDWIEQAETRGLQLITANGEADLTTDGGRMYARIKAAVARGEIERKSARQVRASRQRADHGRPPGGIRLTGYSPTSEIIPAEAAVVVDVFEKFAAGESVVGLVRHLTANGVPTREGNPWTRQSIHGMLRNPRYAGRAVYLGAVNGQAGVWEPIVPESLFDLVQARLNDPARIKNRVGTDRKHLGTSLYRCAECKGTVVTSGPCYLCPKCRLLRTREPIDALVVDVILEWLARPNVAALIAPSNDARVAELEAQAKDLRTQIEVTDADYDAGIITGIRHLARLDRLTAELHTVQVEKVTLLSGSAVSAIVNSDNPPAAFEAAGLGEKRALVDAVLNVELLRGRRGRNVFNPATVLITPGRRVRTGHEGVGSGSQVEE